MLTRWPHKRPVPKSTDYPAWQSAFEIDALRRAWLPVLKNKGRSGSDGESIAQFQTHLEANLYQLQTELLGQSYRPKPVTQVLVPKPGERFRTLTLWAIRDRVVQRAVYNYLEPVFEPQFLPCSFGFRPDLGTRQAAEAVYAAGGAGRSYVFDADIKDCFGQMRSRIVLRLLKGWGTPSPIIRMIDHWLHARIWNSWRPEQVYAGTSQGGVISPLLCNLYLHQLDVSLMRARGLHMVRYADDFLVLCRSERGSARAETVAKRSLKKLGLTLHPHKTRHTSFEAGFQFVGWFFIRDERYQLR